MKLLCVLPKKSCWLKNKPSHKLAGSLHETSIVITPQTLQGICGQDKESCVPQNIYRPTSQRTRTASFKSLLCFIQSGALNGDPSTQECSDPQVPEPMVFIGPEK